MKKVSIQSSAFIIKAAALAAAVHIKQRSRRPPTRLGKGPRFRIRRTVDEIYECLGPIYFRRAYRMTYESFFAVARFTLCHY